MRQAEQEEICREADRIMNGCATNDLWHGSCAVEVVDVIMASCGGDLMCRGQLREFVFTRVTAKTYKFKTVRKEL